MVLQKSRPAVGSFFSACGSALALVSACICTGSWALDAAAPSPESESRLCQGCPRSELGSHDAGQRENALLAWRVELHSERYSDPLPLRHLGQADWAEHVQARSGRNLVQVNQSLALRRVDATSRHQWSLLARQLGRIVMDETTAVRIGQIANGTESTQDWHWRPQLTYQGFAGYGLGWAYLTPQQEGVYFDVGSQLLTVTRLSARNFSGTVDFNASSQRYAFNVQSSRGDSRLAFPFQKPYAETGLALLLNGRVGWRSALWSFNVGVRDAGWLQWQGLPQQDLNYNTQNKVRDANGYILYRPLVQGQNSQNAARWRAPWTGELQAAVNIAPQTSLSLPWEYVPALGWLPAMRWQDQAGALQWSATWRQHQKDVLTQWHWGPWSLTWAAGRIRHSQDLGLSYALVF